MAARGPSLIVTGGCSQWMGWLWDGQSPWCFLCSLIPAYFKNHTLIAVYIPGLGTGDSKLNQIEAFWVKSSGSRRNWHMGKQRKRPTGQKGVVDTRALCWDGFGVGVGGRKWSPPGWVKKAIPSSTGDSVLPQLRGRKMCDDSCVCVCVYRSLARSHRVCRLGLKREIEGFRKEAAHTCPGLLPCPQGQHRQALEAGFSKRQSSHCPRKWELIRNKDAASYRTTFSHPSPDTQVLFVWTFISNRSFKEGPLDITVDPVLCFSCFLMLVHTMKSWRSRSGARWYFLR